MEGKAKLGSLQHQAGGTEVHRGLWSEFCRGGAWGNPGLEGVVAGIRVCGAGALFLL